MRCARCSRSSRHVGCRRKKIRLVSPDIGGGFGGKVPCTGYVIAWASVVIGKPVKWIEDRMENLQPIFARDTI